MAFTRYRSFKVEPNLYIVEPVGGRTYQARARVDGKWHHTGTETGDIKAAEQVALRWFRSLRAGREGVETVQQAADAYFASIRNEGKRDYHAATFGATRDYWTPGMGRPSTTVAEITTPKLLEFIQWRRTQSPRGRSTNPRITSNTLHKDLVTLRQILKYAVARGVIERVPEFPGAHIIGSIEKNPQPWLDKAEWQRLIKVAEQRVKDAPNVRTRAQREELLVWLEFMHATGMRVDEVKALRARDCAVKYTKPATPTVLRDGAVIETPKPYLFINIRQSKTGPRHTMSRPPRPRVLGWLKEKQPDDLLFSEHHRDAFRELLIAADLRVSPFGMRRNAKCLRPTAISHWLIDRPTIPLQWLAANTGTSLVMLQNFYVKRLGLTLDGTAWL